MNLKPFLIGGIVAYFITKKSSSNKTASTGNKSSNNSISFPGYKIIDCKNFKILNDQVAINYAYELGKKISIDNYEIELFHNCLSTIDITNKDNACFLFKLKKYYFTGLLGSGKITEANFGILISKVLKELQAQGINTSDYSTNWNIPIPV